MSGTCTNHIFLMVILLGPLPATEACRWLFAAGLDFRHRNTTGHGAVDAAAWKGHRRAGEGAMVREKKAL